MFLRLNNFEIFSSCEIVFFEKLASAFSFKFKIDKSHLPLELKAITSQACFTSSLTISSLSSGKISRTLNYETKQSSNQREVVKL